MNRLMLLLALALPVNAVALPFGSATLPVPTEWHTLFVVTLERVENAPPLTDDALRMLNMLHIQYQLRLQADGNAVAAGSFGTGGGPIGMTIICADDLAQARARADMDPAVSFGQMRATVRPWHVPAERIACNP